MGSKIKYSFSILFFILLLSISSKIVNATGVYETRPQVLYNLKKLYPRVVQTSSIQSDSIYALQKYQNNTVIHCVKRPAYGQNVHFSRDKKMVLKGFGHTQTWADAGNGEWFVGAGPNPNTKYKFDTELARISYQPGIELSKQADLPKLVNLNYASDRPFVMRRCEAAISPNHHWILIASIDINGDGHFAIYNLTAINSALDYAAMQTNKNVDLRNFTPVEAFHISMMRGIGPAQLNSFQGYELDNQKNIYISREAKPDENGSKFPREIVKIPWRDTDYRNWAHYKIDHPSWKNKATELEGIEINGNVLNLTVAFHKKDAEQQVYANHIYQINNIVK